MHSCGFDTLAVMLLDFLVTGLSVSFLMCPSMDIAHMTAEIESAIVSLSFLVVSR